MRFFRTDNLGLCPYLQLQGLKYCGTEAGLGKHDRPVVMFVFEDPNGIGHDLELTYMRSEFKNYRDMLFFFRNEIEKLQRKVERINREELSHRSE